MRLFEVHDIHRGKFLIEADTFESKNGWAYFYRIERLWFGGIRKYPLGMVNNVVSVIPVRQDPASDQ